MTTLVLTLSPLSADRICLLEQFDSGLLPGVGIAAAEGSAECLNCHSDSHPTRGSSGLRVCPEIQTSEIARRFEHMQGPTGVILLDMLSDPVDLANHKDYVGPVPFDHSAHANWTELTDGCAVCHHYTEEGQAHPACRTCHELGYRHADMMKPGLKGAYHRQCLGCHREWNHETQCGACHLPRNGETEKGQGADLVTKDDLIGVNHPPILEPQKNVFDVNYPSGDGSQVYFHHERHVHEYDLECTDCHIGDSCASCHQTQAATRTVSIQRGEHHKPCSTCHRTENRCESCHRGEGEPEPTAFNHAQTGWSLRPHHTDMSCRDCHDRVPYKGNPDCLSCHDDWKDTAFDHLQVTGLYLDDDHADLDCADCHGGDRFSRQPNCEECHDDKNYPEDRPGDPLVSSLEAVLAED